PQTFNTKRPIRISRKHPESRDTVSRQGGECKRDWYVVPNGMRITTALSESSHISSSIVFDTYDAYVSWHYEQDTPVPWVPLSGEQSCRIRERQKHSRAVH